MLKKLSSEYQLYVCGNFLSKPMSAVIFWASLDFEKNCYSRTAS